MSRLKRLFVAACVLFATLFAVRSISDYQIERFNSNTFNRFELNAVEKTTTAFGEPEKAFKFKMENSYLLAKGIPVNNSVFSVSLWVRFSEVDKHNLLMFIEGDQRNSRFFFLSTFTLDKKHNGLHVGTVNSNRNWGRAYAGNDSLFEPNLWYHIVGVVNTKLGYIKCYLDNKMIVDIPVQRGNIPLSATKLWIGASPEDNSLKLHGEISDVHVYDGELSLEQRNTLHQGKDVILNNDGMFAYLMAVGLVGVVFALYRKIMFVLKGIYVNHRAGIVLVSSVAVLTLGFYNNFWNTANSEEFEYFQKDSESLVIGRLALAKRQGIFSQGGFLCRIEPPYPKNCTPEERNELFTQRYINQYSVYLDNIDTGVYTNYPSQIGFQGMCFAVIDKILNLNPRTNLEILYFLTSFMSAIAISSIIFWMYIQFGVVSSIIVLLLLVFAPSLTLFGRNLYWALWSFYIPFIISIFLLNAEKKRRISIMEIFVFAFVSVIIKCLFTGYEYISAVLIMLTVPYFFYAVLYNWKFAYFIRRFLLVSAGAIAGVLFVLIIHIIQFSVNMPSVNGVNYIIGRFVKRTSSMVFVDERFDPGFHYDRVSILGKYFNQTALSFSEAHTFFPFTITFAQLVWIFLICSMLVFIAENYSPLIAKNRRKLLALMSSLWISFLAPLSWFIIFKQHAYVHIHMDHIVWFMPFVIMGFALCASVGCNLGVDIFLKIKKSHPCCCRGG